MSFNHIVIQNILRDKWTYISYFLSSVFSILVFFFFLITAFHPMMDAIDPNSALGIAMILCSMIVYIFSFIFIIYSMLAFLKKKTKSLGVFIISGASTKQVRKMVFRENMLIAFAAIITAIVVGLIVSPLFLMVVKNVLEADSFGMYVPVQAIAMTVILFSVLFFIVSKITTRFIKKEEAVQLLKADVTQEKINTSNAMEAPFIHLSECSFITTSQS
ncbi:ABC-type antimicrobial peptide transport system permease subunit [Amphibacillus cookii]|nr:ABC-type antimicrobial peptide transport system permease subunit [Amphibacillus cookii]